MFNRNHCLLYDCLNLCKQCILLNFVLYIHEVEIIYHKVDSFIHKHSTLLLIV